MSRVSQEAYRLALRSVIRQKKFLFAVVVSLLPLAAAWIAFVNDQYVAREMAWLPLVTNLTGAVILPAALPLMCLLLAGGMIADEAEERTLSYLLVRPVPRSSLYFSRALAVLSVAAPLAVLQVLGLWVMRWISYGLYAPAGTTVTVQGSVPATTVTAVEVMWTMLPVMLGVALLGTLFYVLVFGAVSVMSTRYHFFVNLGYLGLWEGLLGHVPFRAQKLTITHHLSSLLDHADDTVRLVYGTELTHQAISITLVLVLAAAAAVASTFVVRHRDFHVTSAAT